MKQSITTTVVEAVAADKGVDGTDLPPLHGAIDPDALETVVASARTDGRVFFLEFEFADRLVTIDGNDVSVRSVS